MQLKTQKFTRSVADVRLQFSIKSPVFLNCDGKTKGSELSRAVSGQTLAQHGYRTGTAVGKKRVCVLQIEQVSQLAALVQAQLEYHSRSAEILQQLSSKMEDRY